MKLRRCRSEVMACTIMKYFANAQSEVKCAIHARRHFTCRRHTSRTKVCLSCRKAHLVPPNKKDLPQQVFLFGGRGWIRTIEVRDNRFTVCPLWPLGNSPIFNLRFGSSIATIIELVSDHSLMELVDGRNFS